MAAGLPVVVPRVGALAEVAGEAAVAHTSLSDSDSSRVELVEALQQVHDDDQNRPCREVRASRFVSSFRPEAGLAELIDAYTVAASSARTGAAASTALRDEVASMPVNAVRPALLIAALLIVWGPPALRVSGRGLDTALANPFAFDAAALLQVGAWVFADALAFVLVLSHVARRTGFLSFLLADPPALVRPVRAPRLASVSYSSSPLYTAYFALQIIVGILVLALLEWHWPARRGSRALQVLFVVYGLQAAAVALFYFVRPEWVTPFASGGGSEPSASPVACSPTTAARVCCAACSSSRSRPETRPPPPGGRAVSGLLVVDRPVADAAMAAGAVFLLIMLHANPRARAQATVIGVGAAIAIVGLQPWCPRSCPRRPGAAKDSRPCPAAPRLLRTFSIAGRNHRCWATGSPLGRGTCCSTSCNADT